jgi:manganese/zinc/iron transport system permease protein
MDYPNFETFLRIFSLQDHNTRIVLAGACAFGIAAGLVGAFLLLRKRSLLGDTLGHATLPGVAIGFLVAYAAGHDPRSFFPLALGATLSSVAGIGALALVRRFSRIKDDAALAIVLSVFFGFGIALLSAIQQLPGGFASGLEHLIYGSAATMTSADATFVIASSLGISLFCIALFKEFSLLCFDEAFARSSGWPATVLDILLMSLVVWATVAGIQTVGILLVVALLVIPPASARFWCDGMGPMAAVSTVSGGLSCLLGVFLSALFPKWPTGALSVLSAGSIFAASLVFGPTRGILIRSIRTRRAEKNLRREHLLRAVFECAELTEGSVLLADLLAKRPWTRQQMLAEIALLADRGLLTCPPGNDSVQFTATGLSEARRLVRNHRLWELYLIRHADVAPAHVDREADRIEHVLDRRIVEELEDILDQRSHERLVPSDPEKSQA